MTNGEMFEVEHGGLVDWELVDWELVDWWVSVREGAEGRRLRDNQSRSRPDCR